jgi:DNA-nicking Smr family endonuclease
MTPAKTPTKPLKITALSDLKQVQKAIAEQAQRTAEQQRIEAQKARTQAAQHNLFQAAVGIVKPLAHTARVQLHPAPPAPIPRQQQLDEQAALQESLSDEMDVSNLLETDARLSYRRAGVGPDVTTQLRKGKWAIQGQIDLHGLRTEEARDALATYVREAHQQGLRCVRVVHGKGLGSAGKTPVLKDKVHRWLVQKSEVIAFVQASPIHGGAGALVVLLQTVRNA